MRCAANFAWANRQILMHLVRQAFAECFHRSPKELGLELVYDVAHNIAKLEKHTVDGREKMLCVHRKGATRAFPAGHSELPARYRSVGQPVIIPGDMGRASYLLVGEPKAMDEAFGSTCHGAGRVMSRSAAIKAAKGRSIAAELAEQGIIAMARDRQGLAEEQPAAYKDVSLVVEAVVGAGLARKVARMKPLGVIKG
jgi:tRNA-splicing ligase RtcB